MNALVLASLLFAPATAGPGGPALGPARSAGRVAWQVLKDGTLETPDGKRVKIVDPKERNRKPSRPLDPLIHETAEAAIEMALKRNQAAVVAVGLVEEGDVPPLFRDAAMARASRATVALASVEYFSEDPFFKSRRITKEQVPCVLILDPHGNLLDLRTGTLDPQVILASARNVRTMMRNLLEELPKTIEKAKTLADEKAVLELLRPWLKRHLRGYPGLDTMLEIVVKFGTPRLAAAKSLEDYGKIAADYADSPIEAAALLEMAKLHEKAGKREEAKTLLRRLIGDLPWPENAEIHAKGNAILQEYRREEIQRRREEEEKKKKEEGQNP